MPEFEVKWTTIVEAEDEEDAIKEVYGEWMDPEFIGTYFRVKNLDTGKSTIANYERVLFPERFKEEDDGRGISE